MNLEEGSLLGATPETDLVFADDSRQPTPTRPGMGGLVAVGGFAMPACEVARVSKDIDAICAKSGFPPGEEFKWSPGRSLWMRTELVESARRAFFTEVIATVASAEPSLLVVVADTTARSATGAATPEEDATRMFLERVEHQCTDNFSSAIVIVDRPGGGRSEEDAFLSRCLETIQQGTDYVKPRRIIHNVVSTPSQLSRMLQMADVITGITTARIAGEPMYSPPLFDLLRPMFYRSRERIGGYGLKIHPALRYGNLYHWIVGDSHFWRLNVGLPLPHVGWPYAASEFQV